MMPDDPTVNMALAMVLKMNNKPNEAIERLQKVVALEPNNGDAHYTLASRLDLNSSDGAVLVSEAPPTFTDPLHRYTRVCR